MPFLLGPHIIKIKDLYNQSSNFYVFMALSH